MRIGMRQTPGQSIRLISVGLLVLGALPVLALEGPGEGDPIARFVQVCHLLVPLPASGAVEVRSDPLRRRVVIDMPTISRTRVRQLRTQVEAGGGRVVATRRANGRVVVDLSFPFQNFLVEHALRSKPRRLVVDVGVGRTLIPGRPWIQYARFLPSGDPDADALLHFEKQLASGPVSEPPAGIEVLALNSTRAGLLACIRLADQAAVSGLWTKAKILAETCARNARAIQSPLEALADLQVLAYSGALFGSPGLQVEEPGEDWDDWLAAEVRFQLSRIHHARGEFDRVLEQSVAVAHKHEASQRAVDIRPLALDALRRFSEEGNRSGRYCLVARALLDGLRWFGPLTREQAVEFVSLAADALLKAGTADLAIRLLTWHLRVSSDGRANPDVLILLAQAFIDRGDTYRASRTLDFLKAQSPGVRMSKAASVLRGDILAGEGRHAEAVVEYSKVLAGGPRSTLAPEAGLRVARLLRSQGQPEQALALANLAASQLLDGPQDQAQQDLLMLRCDLAYGLERKAAARACYREVLKRQPEGSRAAAAGYRLQRLGDRSALTRGPEEEFGDAAALWWRAQRAGARFATLKELDR
jgi:predicted negative regulator of RcsB-dependent stress response